LHHCEKKILFGSHFPVTFTVFCRVTGHKM
jgi:hypothetical protein